MNELEQLNRDYVRSVQESDVRWFEAHLSEDFLNTNPDGTLIGKIHLPEAVSNMCFGGPKKNRLFITASQSLYADYVEKKGVKWP